MREIQKAITLSVIGSLAGYSRKKFQKFELFLGKLLQRFSTRPLSEWDSELADAIQVSRDRVEEEYSRVSKVFYSQKIEYETLSFWDENYPKLLRMTGNAPLCLFLQGDPFLLDRPVISIVGTRKASEKGKLRAKKLAFLLSGNGFVVASGLAEGIDTAAHTGTLQCGGRTIAVIGTPLSKSYPVSNRGLQTIISEQGLLISQFPFSIQVTPACFPIRNYTMSGISAATVVIEAAETSGALVQAQQCLEQGNGRRLFILKNVLDNPSLAWPRKFQAMGAVVIDDDNLEALLGPLYSLRNFEAKNSDAEVKVASVSMT